MIVMMVIVTMMMMMVTLMMVMVMVTTRRRKMTSMTSQGKAAAPAERAGQGTGTTERPGRSIYAFIIVHSHKDHNNIVFMILIVTC